MRRTKNQRLILAGSAVLLAGVSLAFVQGPGILFPSWSQPTKGTADEPAAAIGKATSDARPWSITTVASSIDGKPIEGKPISLVGEVVDLSCYLQVGKHGDKHRDCGMKCARAGQPIGLVTSDGSVYTLVAEEHDPRRDGQTTLRETLIEHMAYVIKVDGTITSVDGQKTVFVQGFVK